MLPALSTATSMGKQKRAAAPVAVRSSTNLQI
jgi:hypothetical protein